MEYTLIVDDKVAKVGSRDEITEAAKSYKNGEFMYLLEGNYDEVPEYFGGIKSKSDMFRCSTCRNFCFRTIEDPPSLMLPTCDLIKKLVEVDNVCGEYNSNINVELL